MSSEKQTMDPDAPAPTEPGVADAGGAPEEVAAAQAAAPAGPAEPAPAAEAVLDPEPVSVPNLAEAEADGTPAETPDPAEGEVAVTEVEPSPMAEAPAAGPEDEIAEAREQAGRYLAFAQRTQADFENFRKRAAREATASADRGTSRLAKELLPALDHLELALQASEQDPAAAELAKGVRLVQDELVKALGRAGIQTYSPQGERFDPEFHEAMAQLPSEDAETGTVLEVYQPGYRLNGLVLRPARVVVAA